MSEIKALEKLREYDLFVRVEDGSSHGCAIPSGKLADEIQAEIDERFMKLPVDADGMPIQVADYLHFCDFDIQCAAVSPERVYYWDEYSDAHWVKGCECRHVKPRTLEDVLEEMAFEVDYLEHCQPNKINEIVGKTAAEIYELLGVSA